MAAPDRGGDRDGRVLRAPAVLAEQPEEHLQQNLVHLQAAEFLYETRLFPEPEYIFTHALTHEVAYGSLLLERRRGLHARLVEAIEALAPDRAAEQVERLAHHALRSEVWDKAVTCCQQVSARANDRAAFREAVAAFDQAFQALAHLPDHRDTRGRAIDLRLVLGGVLGALGEYGRRLALLGEAEALALADELSMRPLVAHCHHGLGRLYATTGQREQARAALTAAIDMYRAMDMTFWLPQAEAALAQAA